MQANHRPKVGVQQITRDVIKEIFSALLLTFSILFIADTIQPGIVSDIFNLKAMIIWILLAGFALIAVTNTELIETPPPHITSVFLVFLSGAAGVLSAALVALASRDLGVMALVIAAATGIMVGIVTYFTNHK
ncbi:MAG: hypothetical protein V1685_02500 [Parcubacteria group bacterium]